MKSAEPRVKRWSRAEYYQMAAIGLITGKHIELIDGEIIEVSPMSHIHAVAVVLASRALNRAFGPEFCIRCQLPLAISQFSEPEPEFAVVKCDPREFKDHPATALLAVEISLSSLPYDRFKKASLYASAGVPEYWIVNLVDRRLEVFRNPVKNAEQPFGFEYANATLMYDNESIVALSSGVAIAVNELLP